MKIVMITFFISLVAPIAFFAVREDPDQDDSSTVLYSLKEADELEFRIPSCDLSITLHFPTDPTWRRSQVSTRKNAEGVESGVFSFLFSNQQGDEEFNINASFSKEIRISVNDNLIFEESVDALLRGKDLDIFINP
jgi:hypothetical protein